MGCPFMPTEPPVENCRRCTESPHPGGKALGCPGGCPDRKGRDGSRKDTLLVVKAVVKVTQMPCPAVRLSVSEVVFTQMPYGDTSE